MDNVYDSGIDSDQKMSAHDADRSSPANKPDVRIESGSHSDHKLPEESSQNRTYSLHKTSDLQKKIEKQRNAYKNTYNPGTQKSQTKRIHILPRSRLKVPTKQTVPAFSPLSQEDASPLIQIVSDSSEEDELESPFHTRAKHAINAQLLKDGYNLDMTPDDEDLDLIPPISIFCGVAPHTIIMCAYSPIEKK